MANGWVTTGSAEMDDEALGKTVRAALAASGNNVGMPDFSRPLPAWQKVLAAAGATSEQQFAKGNVMLGVELKGDIVELLPTRNDGRGGFDHLPELVENIHSAANNAALGSRVRQAVARSC